MVWGLFKKKGRSGPPNGIPTPKPRPKMSLGGKEIIGNGSFGLSTFPDIINEIYDKIHAFGIKNFGKHPNWIHLNRDHFTKLKMLENYYMFMDLDYKTGEFKTIMGMQHHIKDIDEIEVQ